MLNGVIEDDSEGPVGYRPEKLQFPVGNATRAGGRDVSSEFYC